MVIIFTCLFMHLYDISPAVQQLNLPEHSLTKKIGIYYTRIQHIYKYRHCIYFIVDTAGVYFIADLVNVF